MITITALISGTWKSVSLPHYQGFSVNPSRPIASRKTIAGNVIHQTAAKDYSTAEAVYSGEIAAADALTLDAIDKGTSSCIISDGAHAYEAVIDASFGNTLSGSRKAVVINFKIVRRVL